jgi:hypothetical protein
MLLFSWLSWWYTRGWQETSISIRTRILRLTESFSVAILLRTLFAPWRRIVTGGTGPIDQRLRAAADNTVSRAVGFVVRVGALLVALFLIALTAISGGLIVLIWPFIPVAGLGLIVVGIIQ